MGEKEAKRRESAMFQKNTILINENDRLKEQLEQLLKELIDRKVIFEWYKNGNGYHWSYVKTINDTFENPEPLIEVKPITAKELKEDDDISYKLRDAVQGIKHYRPFNDCDELIEHFMKMNEVELGNTSIYYPQTYKPCIWVKHKRYGTENLIIAFDNDNESIGGSCVFIQDMWVDMQELFDNFTFLDGSPCGLEE